MAGHESISPTRQRETANGNATSKTADYTVVSGLNLSEYSETLLELCVRTYLRKFRPIFPFLHISTVRTRKTLHRVIAAVGASSFDSPQIRSQGRQLFKLVYSSVRVQIAEASGESTQATFALLHAAVLLQFSVIIFGLGIIVDEACDLHGQIAVYAQKHGYFATTHPRIPEHFKSPAEETLGWNIWCKVEETIGAVLMLYVLDTQLFIAQRPRRYWITNRSSYHKRRQTFRSEQTRQKPGPHNLNEAGRQKHQACKLMLA